MAKLETDSDSDEPKTMKQVAKIVGPKIPKIPKISGPRFSKGAPLKSPMRNMPKRPSGGR